MVESQLTVLGGLTRGEVLTVESLEVEVVEELDMCIEAEHALKTNTEMINVSDRVTNLVLITFCILYPFTIRTTSVFEMNRLICESIFFNKKQ